MSDTPRTDAAPCTRADIICNDGHRRVKYTVEIDFARELERENAKLRAIAETVIEHIVAYKISDHDLILDEESIAPIRTALANAGYQA